MPRRPFEGRSFVPSKSGGSAPCDHQGSEFAVREHLHAHAARRALIILLAAVWGDRRQLDVKYTFVGGVTIAPGSRPEREKPAKGPVRPQGLEEDNT